ncbi:hypothetical protein [Streptomyces lavendofoliae]|uniref:Uncharacterized protein n=1 Tax=Streptomyces lavendofoliae TaxID=67314 RepID=A0A918M6T1_9ACTN|nr:hypothetical protein [Streptomyces lavendofoliae]GGU62101.1 hypothetical protein GCM10010274_58590 [Streptomyces lavendofoliae]
MTDIPEPTVVPVRYLVSCLPEGHDDRWLFSIQVEYRGNGLWAVKLRSQTLGADGTWSFGLRWIESNREPDPSEVDAYDKAQAAWLAEHRFDHDTALRLAREHAPRLRYRGYTVADALRETSRG